MLTAKQDLFVDEYLIDLNATQAAIRAGYSKKTAHVQGCRLLTNAKVAAAIQKAVGERMQRTEITQDWVIERLVENLKRAMTAKPVLDKNGEPTGEYTYNGAVANRSLELIGRHLAMFTDRSEVDVNVSHRIEALNDLDVDELRVIVSAWRDTQRALEGPLIEGEAIRALGDET